ncbi:MAG: DUF192 domain-containing protein [Burkholderiales bacterium]|nr:DUF192 domain-containing protein [Burkholderiales bacterium]
MPRNPPRHPPSPPQGALLRTLLAACALALAAPRPAAAQQGPQPRLPTTDLTIGIYVIHAELATTPDQQETGMMFRRSMGSSDGMLFVNDDSSVRCFWMHNTLLPLTIAFIADDGRIVNLADMAAQTDATHCSAKPVRYALEVPLGWFARRGFKAGDRLRGRPFGN